MTRARSLRLAAASSTVKTADRARRWAQPQCQSTRYTGWLQSPRWACGGWTRPAAGGDQETDCLIRVNVRHGLCSRLESCGIVTPIRCNNLVTGSIRTALLGSTSWTTALSLLARRRLVTPATPVTPARVGKHRRRVLPP